VTDSLAVDPIIGPIAAYFSPLAGLLDTVKPYAADWAVIVACALPTIGIVEIAKLAFRWRQHADFDWA